MSNLTSIKKLIAITYTNRAADEMLERLTDMGVDSENIWIGTIHAFCIEYILRPYSMYNKRLRKGYRIIDDYKKRTYIEEIADELDIELRFFDHVNTEPTLQGKLDNTDKFYPIIIDYHKKLLDNKELDFSLILYYAYKIINMNPVLCQKLSNAFRCIFIDEFQDTNNIQYHIISSIFCSNNDIKILFAGDPNQAIYTGLGGVAKTHSEIEVLFKESFKHMNINGCYRSTQEIINFYSNFATNKMDISTLKTSQDNCLLYYNQSVAKDSLSKTLGNIINKQINNNVALKDICILAPQWWLIYPFAREIKSMLPNVKFDAPEITPIKKNPLNIMYNISKIALTEPGHRSLYRKRIALSIIETLNEDYQIYTGDIEEFKVLKQINSVNSEIYTSGIEYIKACTKTLFKSLPISPLANKKFSKDYDDFFESIEDRISRYSLDDSTSSFINSFKEKEGIVINTIHGIKGEEYKVVICFGLLKGYLPHWNNVINDIDDGFEVANKLLYVLVSRAKEQIYLISETGRETQAGNPLIPTCELIDIVNMVNKDFNILIS